MNDEILRKHMEEDAKFQQAMLEWKESIATKEDIEKIVATTIENYFITKGRLSYRFVIGSSIFIAALVVIFGGVKSILAWLGFTYISK